MSYLDRLAALEAPADFSETPGEGTDKTAKTPGAGGSVSFGSAPRGVSRKFDARELAELEAAAGEDWPDVRDRPEALEALAVALETRAMRDRGEVPAHYTRAALCASCGPVWLWEGAPERVLGCPWCFNRAAGKPIPRPPVEPDP